MCGIAGYHSIKDVGNAVERANVMVKAIAHRGPDSNGVYYKDNVVLCHARLSVIDLSVNANQPFYSFDKRYVMVYNGEVYNYKEIKKKLIQAGYHFTTTSDTEVVLNAYLHWGKDAFAQFNGMFALAIYDTLTAELVLARDQSGIKPLYYYFNGETFVFASEVKAIVASGLYSPILNESVICTYMWYGNTSGKESFYKGIYKLLPGYFAEINSGTFTITSYFDSLQIVPKEEKEAHVIEKAIYLLERAVQRQLVGDVPIGIFLSGGIDSSTIAAFATKHYTMGKINTYSVGFDFNANNELLGAARYAKELGTNHHEIFISGDNVIDTFETLIKKHDEPFADAANIPLYMLTKELKGSIKVVLQGDGGDEIFGGYSRYHTVTNINKYRKFEVLLSLLPYNVSKNTSYLRLRRFISALNEKDHVLRNALLLTMETAVNNPTCVFNDEYRQVIEQYSPFQRYYDIYKRIGEIGPVDKLFLADFNIILPDTFLEKVDKSTMANGIEVRVPFLDLELVKYMLSITANVKVKNGVQKYILKKALGNTLPSYILNAKKRGFGVPYGEWLARSMYDYMHEVIINESQLNPILNKKVILQRMKDHKAGKGNYGFQLWKLLTFVRWTQLNKISI